MSNPDPDSCLISIFFGNCDEDKGRADSSVCEGKVAACDECGGKRQERILFLQGLNDIELNQEIREMIDVLKDEPDSRPTGDYLRRMWHRRRSHDPTNPACREWITPPIMYYGESWPDVSFSLPELAHKVDQAVTVGIPNNRTRDSGVVMMAGAKSAIIRWLAHPSSDNALEIHNAMIEGFTRTGYTYSERCRNWEEERRLQAQLEAAKDNSITKILGE